MYMLSLSTLIIGGLARFNILWVAYTKSTIDVCSVYAFAVVSWMYATYNIDNIDSIVWTSLVNG